jgi:hypothetical protein
MWLILRSLTVHKTKAELQNLTVARNFSCLLLVSFSNFVNSFIWALRKRLPDA